MEIDMNTQKYGFC